MPVIDVRNLTKSYGKVHALQGLTLSVGKGEIYGLLGRNGAGKTTLVKILLSIVRATGGQAEMLGHPVPHTASREKVGYLPEDHRFPDYLTAESALDFYGSLCSVPRNERRLKIPALLEEMDLKEAAGRKIRTYSKGMKQRLGLAQAILHDPDVIFLDEPTDGVDPVGRKAVRDLMMRLKREGKTIFLNSHLLSEVERICDRVGILDHGKMMREGGVEALTQTANVYEIKFEGSVDAAWEDLVKRVTAARKVGDAIEIELSDEKKLDEVIDLLRSKGVSVRGVTAKKRSLEDIFIDTVTEQ